MSPLDHFTNAAQVINGAGDEHNSTIHLKKKDHKCYNPLQKVNRKRNKQTPPKNSDQTQKSVGIWSKKMKNEHLEAELVPAQH